MHERRQDERNRGDPKKQQEYDVLEVIIIIEYNYTGKLRYKT